MTAPPRLPHVGPIIQNGFVVNDIETAVAHWSGKLGIGPFYMIEHIDFGESYFRGQPLKLDMSVAIAQWGEIQVELIQQHDMAPSIYTEFKSRHDEGLQHVGVLTQSLDTHLAHLSRLGLQPVQWGATAAGMRFAYLDSDAHPGGMVELIETGPAVEAFFSRVRKAADSWDGSRPLRRLS